ncbi:hypothetical protein KR018_011390 [Drosophila ironensis]|nr:hypothetical protein KR018_011390 [Drosophila ironensis]
MNCLKICGFFFALIAALATAEAGKWSLKEIFYTDLLILYLSSGTQVINAGGHTLIQTDRSQYIRKN